MHNAGKVLNCDVGAQFADMVLGADSHRVHGFSLPRLDVLMSIMGWLLDK